MCTVPNTGQTGQGDVNSMIERQEKLTDILTDLDPQSVDRKPLEEEWLLLEDALRKAIPDMKPADVPVFQPTI